MDDDLKQCKKKKGNIVDFFFFLQAVFVSISVPSLCSACCSWKQPARCPAMQVALGPLLTQKYQLYSIPLCSSRQVWAVPSCPFLKWALVVPVWKERINSREAPIAFAFWPASPSGWKRDGRRFPSPWPCPPRSPFSPRSPALPFCGDL